MATVVVTRKKRRSLSLMTLGKGFEEFTSREIMWKFVFPHA
jgi:hypothetical protein